MRPAPACRSCRWTTPASALVVVEHRHGHDAVRLHAVHHRARELAAVRELRGVRVMMRSTGTDSTSVSCSMSRVRSPAVSTPCSRRRRPTTSTMPRRSASTTTACAQRRARRQHRQRIGEHHVVHPREQPPAERAARMEPREVLAPESLLLEQRHRERVAERERGGGARGRREVVRARLLAHPRVERHVAVAARASSSASPVIAMVRTPSRLRCSSSDEQLVGLAALGDEDRDVVGADDAEVAVHALDRMEERSPACRSTSASRRSCGRSSPDLPTPATITRPVESAISVDGPRERVAEPLLDRRRAPRARAG